ncbi:Smr/MutS family protein [Streptomyces sp. NPDC048527]|uniref:Smr/MutS family protein n=1 Tax=Streptomyces sp. NPDC048527 TaxID=3365568 RepID=UPI00371342E7
MTLLTLDLHPIFRDQRAIDLALRDVIFKAVRTGETVVEIIPGKGSGRLRSQVMASLEQKHIRIRKLYVRVDSGTANTGRIRIHCKGRQRFRDAGRPDRAARPTPWSGVEVLRRGHASRGREREERSAQDIFSAGSAVSGRRFKIPAHHMPRRDDVDPLRRREVGLR